MCMMHDLAQSVMKEECYTMKANSSSDGLEREIHRHVTIDKFNEPYFCSLKEIRGSHSIMVVNCGDYDGIVAREILNVLKELLPLRVLEVRWYVHNQDLSYVSRLKHLRYLDISKSKITTLHDNICELFNLQTLKLNSCSMLESLPRNMRNLVNLRHLYLEDCDGIKYMHRGMGQMKHLKTLSLFVIGKKDRYGQLDEIKELDIGGSLTIKNLGRVSDAFIARTLEEGFNCEVEDIENERLQRCESPKWVGKSSPSVLFPLLERLTVSFMMNLRELVSPTTIPSTGAFLDLCSLRISYCPKLGALLVPHLKSLKYVSVYDECSDELLYSISNLSTLTHLYLYGLNERSVLFPLSIFADNNEAQLGGVRSTFQSLSLENCENLRRLFDEGMIMEEETHHDHHFQAGQTERTRGLINSLTKLEIVDCPELMISVEEFGNLNSLQRLTIQDCPKLVSSEEEADDFKALLRSLRTRLGRKKFRVDIELEKALLQNPRRPLAFSSIPTILPVPFFLPSIPTIAKPQPDDLQAPAGRSSFLVLVRIIQRPEFRVGVWAWGLAAKTVFESDLNITLIPLSVQRKLSEFPVILGRLRINKKTPEAFLAKRLLSRLYKLQQKKHRYQHVGMFLGEILGAVVMAGDRSQIYREVCCRNGNGIRI
ncbi:putative disease resistance RPP13-like protein 1 [Impatiens glandulifera]|uniref:putative disease resistance RPP13-like protein 1 n=1 Tax=Impatiens glandulifera TaxID=253017 RepID=UPI001FB07C59|nr:putative disease resistance RPP13-like protein 1 [Impatiens glandulifera]